MLRTSHFASALIAAALAACGSGTPTCVTGSTQACLCPGNAFGIQSCNAQGTYGDCHCDAVDGGTSHDVIVPSDNGPVDASSMDTGVDAPSSDDVVVSQCAAPLTMCTVRCVDTATDEANCGTCGNACATGSFCVSGACQNVGACPPPFVMCGSDCIDPRTDAAHCGASGSCAGANAGATCAAACVDGECVAESCDDILGRGLAHGDGLYLVDVDGTGPVPPRRVYCDMTTDGGGWTLVYKIRNDVPDISDPWWGMVGLGSGDQFPQMPTPIPSGMHFEGATRDVRFALYSRTMINGYRFRATLLSASGNTLLDIVTSETATTVGFASAGYLGTIPNCSNSSSQPGYTIAAAPVTGLTAGESITECAFANGGQDYESVLNTQRTVSAPIVGDSTIASINPMYANSTTLFWIRTRHP